MIWMQFMRTKISFAQITKYINPVGYPSHTTHPLACRWKMKRRGRRNTQEEHTRSGAA